MTHTPAFLAAFERSIAEDFDAGRIKAPIHLSGGNEAQLIAYFAERFRPGDWVFSTWRSHFHALLAGVPEDEVRSAILAGRSITLCWPEHRFLSSAIVGGHLPIALGVALGIKRAFQDAIERDILAEFKLGDLKYDENGLGRVEEAVQHGIQERNEPPHVHAFVGDMAARTGAFHEAREYAIGHDLPITFVIEDNGKSVMTNTTEVWGETTASRWSGHAVVDRLDNGLWSAPSLKTIYYSYSLAFPHSGARERTNF